jgi:hypothetical protein
MMGPAVDLRFPENRCDDDAAWWALRRNLGLVSSRSYTIDVGPGDVVTDTELGGLRQVVGEVACDSHGWR